MSACGTQYGYKRHEAEATAPCPACRGANSDAVKASRIRRGKQKALHIPAGVLRETLAAHPCDALRAFLGEQLTRAVLAAPEALGAQRPS